MVHNTPVFQGGLRYLWVPGIFPGTAYAWSYCVYLLPFDVALIISCVRPQMIFPGYLKIWPVLWAINGPRIFVSPLPSSLVCCPPSIHLCTMLATWPWSAWLSGPPAMILTWLQHFLIGLPCSPIYCLLSIGVLPFIETHTLGLIGMIC